MSNTTTVDIDLEQSGGYLNNQKGSIILSAINVGVEMESDCDTQSGKGNNTRSLINKDRQDEHDNKNSFELPDLWEERPIHDSKNYFSNSQRWIGYVIEVKDDHFIARLEDISQNDTHEIGEFDIEEISKDDLELFKVGAAFYWSIGHAVTNGQVTKESLIRFQRKYWDVSDIDQASDRADYLFNKLKWED